ncbi:hypothetical protein PDE_09263 [Penicillium oxalicum 114-2]|uniref:Uncharacterized protein n=1 Tax=Penicillium oxalicum (strain 114-2 / CGMCC 5302) TaxID=933388 RepID=S7ZV61_PENO1|nr:hypothetical protein PDE_09263 [Penicillium oxalicum 114-2]
MGGKLTEPAEPHNITLEKTVSTWNMLCQFTSNVGG